MITSRSIPSTVVTFGSSPQRKNPNRAKSACCFVIFNLDVGLRRISRGGLGPCLLRTRRPFLGRQLGALQVATGDNDDARQAIDRGFIDVFAGKGWNKLWSGGGAARRPGITGH